MRRNLPAGRQILCNHCSHKTVEGTAQVYRKLLFFFCPKCWFGDRAGCNRQMEQAGDKRAIAELLKQERSAA